MPKTITDGLDLVFGDVDVSSVSPTYFDVAGRHLNCGNGDRVALGPPDEPVLTCGSCAHDLDPDTAFACPSCVKDITQQAIDEATKELQAALTSLSKDSETKVNELRGSLHAARSLCRSIRDNGLTDDARGVLVTWLSAVESKVW